MIIKKLIGRIIGLRVVCLCDFDGTRTVSFERKFPDGASYAYRFFMIGCVVILNDDGTTSGRSYVKTWRYV